jgi:hypothetical protein
MKFAPRGNGTSAEVTNISKHGFWLLLGDRELFVPFAQFPWFKRRRQSICVMSSGRTPITCIGLHWMWIWQSSQSSVRNNFRWSRSRRHAQA